MSLFDAKVLQWAQTAHIDRGDKVDLLNSQLHCIEGYKHVDGARLRGGVEEDIAHLKHEIEEDIVKHGNGPDDRRTPATPPAPPVQAPAQAQPKAKAARPRAAFAADDGVRVGFAFGASDGPSRGGGGGEPTSPAIDEATHNRNVAGKRSTRRKTVSSEVINTEDVDGFEAPVYEKEDEEAAWLYEVMEHQYLFDHLDHDELAVLVSAMMKKEVAAGDDVFTQGDDGDTLYIIYAGEGKGVKDGVVLETYERGAHIGEEELMYSAEAAFTFEAVSDLTLFSLDRSTYRTMVTKASMKKRALYEDFLSNIDFLQGLTAFERLQVADALKTTEHKDGDKIISYGEEGTHFHIIVSGSVKVVGRAKEDSDREVDVCTFEVGDCVGELEFINEHATCADVVAVGDVKSAKMGRRHFEKIMGPVKEFLKDRYKVCHLLPGCLSHTWRTHTHVRIQDHEKFEYYRNKLDEQ